MARLQAAFLLSIPVTIRGMPKTHLYAAGTLQNSLSAKLQTSVCQSHTKALSTQDKQRSPRASIVTPISLPHVNDVIVNPFRKSVLEKAVPYFAYFSNMNPNTLGPRSSIPPRRVKILQTSVATLSNHDIVFDVPGLPPEPAFANLKRSKGSEVHGVVHWMSEEDFRNVTISEGIFPMQSVRWPLSQLPRIGEVRDVEVIVTTGNGDKFPLIAKTFFFFTDRVPLIIRSVLRPSQRYVTTAIDGAEYWNVDAMYVQNVLRKTKTAGWLLGGFPILPNYRPQLLDRRTRREQ